ncbi:hypothetical protein, partial [Escherichia coli]|uniref:hypothetical protein n=1 Tax=Escherichia coli TaxID=562 RepID=UPI00195384C4
GSWSSIALAMGSVIGSPSMNFFETSVTNSGGHATLHCSNIEFTLDVDIPDGEYTLGVRPLE